MKKYYIVKVSKMGNELLEVFEAGTEKEARKAMCRKYMDIVLSCVTQLAVVTKPAYDKYYA